MWPYLPIFFSLFSGAHRDILEDSRAILKNHSPRADIRHMENIPPKGPYLITLNHYSRPGFFILWAALEICAALPEPSIWLMTAAWTNRSGGFDLVSAALTRVVFGRLAYIYGLVTMPPMPPSSDEATRRALSIQRLLGKLRKQPDAILCIAPEGMDFPGGMLGVPYPGTGRMLLQVANILKRVIPVGVYEEEVERLVINFGHPYELRVPGKDENIDKVVTDQVMRHIASLLPAKMRGLYK